MKNFLMTLAVLALLPLGVAADEEFNYSCFDVADLNNRMLTNDTLAIGGASAPRWKVTATFAPG